MTRLHLILLATVAAAYAYSEIRPKKAYDPLEIDPNAHPKYTLHRYLTSLTNYIYGTNHILEDDPRATFFYQEHQLRIYETLNHYVEENYGSTLREILSRPGDYLHYPETAMWKRSLTTKIINLADRITEMYFKVIYTAGDKTVDQESLQQVHDTNRDAVNLYAKYATYSQLQDVYGRMQSIHDPVLKNFTNNIWGEEETKIKVKREAHIDVDLLKVQLGGYLQKLSVHIFGASEAEYLYKKISISFDLYNQPLASQIAFKRFLQANYREVLEHDLPSVNDKEAKEQEIEEIKQIEEKTTALWFEVVNYANLDLLKNQTTIDGINAAMAERLEGYKYFSSLDGIKDTNRKIHEVYGHLFKDCDQSTYLNLLKVFKELNLLERYPNPSRGFILMDIEHVDLAIKISESIWQPKHGMSKDERNRVTTLIYSVDISGIHVLTRRLLDEFFENGWRIPLLEGFKLPGRHFNETENFQRTLFNETDFELKKSNETSELRQ